MAEILAHPQILKNLKHELSNVVGMNNIVEEYHLPNLKYLEASKKEALRLHPPLPLLLPKCPTHSTLVGGFTIPKEIKKNKPLIANPIQRLSYLKLYE
ncbi:hypothetical protein LIER_15325 [Lithospermum erythrorhizon]|uniref:Cytochrome P450 n=1 Tax=Lithospermum erythrorhizon TaxID=34254 RepID=A0AAV3Q3E0_LITER